MDGKVFFPGQRLKLNLHDYNQLGAKTIGENKKETIGKRKRIWVTMELAGGRLQGMPEYIYEGLIYLAKDGNYVKRVTLAEEVLMEGMTVTFYATDSTPQLFAPSSNAVLEKLRLHRSGREEKAHFFLDFFLTVPDTEHIHKFVKENYRSDFYASFDQAQGVLNMDLPQDVEVSAKAPVGPIDTNPPKRSKPN